MEMSQIGTAKDEINSMDRELLELFMALRNRLENALEGCCDKCYEGLSRDRDINEKLIGEVDNFIWQYQIQRGTVHEMNAFKLGGI